MCGLQHGLLPFAALPGHSQLQLQRVRSQSLLSGCISYPSTALLCFSQHIPLSAFASVWRTTWTACCRPTALPTRFCDHRLQLMETVTRWMQPAITLHRHLSPPLFFFLCQMLRPDAEHAALRLGNCVPAACVSGQLVQDTTLALHLCHQPPGYMRMCPRGFVSTLKSRGSGLDAIIRLVSWAALKHLGEQGPVKSKDPPSTSSASGPGSKSGTSMGGTTPSPGGLGGSQAGIIGNQNRKYWLVNSRRDYKEQACLRCGGRRMT